jgi:hypothetical protein
MPRPRREPQSHLGKQDLGSREELGAHFGFDAGDGLAQRPGGNAQGLGGAMQVLELSDGEKMTKLKYFY